MSVSRRPLLSLCMAAGALLPGAVSADLSVSVPAPRSQPKPPPGKTVVKPLTIPLELRTPTTGADRVISRDSSLQIGVARRGGPPVLPPADGSATSAAPAILDQVPIAAPPIEVNARLGRITAPTSEAYRLPDPKSAWVGRLKQGQQVAVASQWQGWFAVVMGDGTQAYVPQAQVELLPYQVKTVTPTVSLQSAAAMAPDGGSGASGAEMYETPPTEMARAVIEAAFRYRGVPYVYGGNSEAGIDCSGLVRNCFALQGIQLPRRASEQAEVGTAVALNELQPGDRLYFSVKRPHDHTGIYLGRGYFIHAARSRGRVTIDHLSTPLYGNNLSTARRF